MAKNDKLKEKIAELRHKDITLLMYGTFGFAGLALTIAFVAWLYGTSGFAAWQKVVYSLLFSLPVATLVWAAVSYVSRNKREREDLIKQLGNTEKKPVPDNSTKEPKIKEIMDKLHKIQGELKEAEGKSRVMMWITFMVVGAAIIVASLEPQYWWTILGGVMFIIGGLGVWQRWSPW